MRCKLAPVNLSAIDVSCCFARSMAKSFAFGRAASFAPGAVMFDPAAEVGGFTLIEDGYARLFSRDPDGRLTTIYVAGPGAVIGDDVSFGEGPALHGVQAITRVTARQISQEAFVAQSAGNFDLLVAMITVVSSCLHSYVSHLDEMKLMSATQRLARFLYRIMEPRENGYAVRLPILKEDIAAHLGMTPQSLSRCLRALQEKGIDVEGDEITITDIEPLRAAAVEDEDGEDDVSVEQRLTGWASGQEADAELVRRTPFFHCMAAELADRLLEDARVVDCPEDYLLFGRGEPARAFFVVLNGVARLYTNCPAGGENLLHVVRAGDVFAQAPALRGVPYPVSCETLGHCRFLRIPVAKVISGLREMPGLGLAVIGSLEHYKRRLLQAIVEIKTQTPAERVCAYLLGLARAAAAEGGRGPVRLTLGVPRTLMAAQIGVTRESLSRIFAKLREVGVRVDGVTVEIDDLSRLRQPHLPPCQPAL